MLWVPFGGAVESAFLGCQDLSPSVCEQILVSLELLFLLLQASCSGHKPVFLFGLLEGRLIGIVFIFGTIRIIFVSCAGIAVAGLEAALMTPML